MTRSKYLVTGRALCRPNKTLHGCSASNTNAVSVDLQNLDSCDDETDGEDMNGEESECDVTDADETDGVSIFTSAAMAVIIAVFTKSM